MTLSVKGLAFTAAILWAAACFLVGTVNLIWPPYGEAMLTLVGSLYPGYPGPTGFGSVLVLASYALLDGAVCGALFGLLYNKLAGQPHAPAM